MKILAFILGALLIAIAATYFLFPADALPSFMPGHEAGLLRPRMKHGIAAGALGIVMFVIGWFLGRRS